MQVLSVDKIICCSSIWALKLKPGVIEDVERWGLRPRSGEPFEICPSCSSNLAKLPSMETMKKCGVLPLQSMGENRCARSGRLVRACRSEPGRVQ